MYHNYSIYFTFRTKRPHTASLLMLSTCNVHQYYYFTGLFLRLHVEPPCLQNIILVTTFLILEEKIKEKTNTLYTGTTWHALTVITVIPVLTEAHRSSHKYSRYSIHTVISIPVQMEKKPGQSDVVLIGEFLYNTLESLDQTSSHLRPLSRYRVELTWKDIRGFL